MTKIVTGLALALAASLALSATASAATITAPYGTGFQEVNLGAGSRSFQNPIGPVNTSAPPTQIGPAFDDGPGHWDATGIIASGTAAWGLYATPAGDTTHYLAVLADPAGLTPETLTLCAVGYSA